MGPDGTGGSGTDFPGGRLLSFNQPPETLARYIDQCGNMPLPPYIKRPAEPLDKEAYQTVLCSYPRFGGSAYGRFAFYP